MAVAVTINVSGKDYGFDFDAERIDVDATVDTLMVEDLYTAIKGAQYDPVGMVYPKIANAEGKVDIGDSLLTALTVTLLRGWEVNTLKSSGKFTVSGGNLTHAILEEPFLDNPLITYINNVSQTGVIAETGVSGLTAAESAQLELVAKLVAADHYYDQSTGKLHYYERGTTVDLITAKDVTGTTRSTDAEISEA